MKRTSLSRKTPMRRARVSGTGKRRTKTSKTTSRGSSSTKDPTYLARVRQLICCAYYLGGSCESPIDAHHPRHLAPGIARKAPDACAIPMCRKHHACLHGLLGPFKGWKRDRLREWQDWAVTRTQEALSDAGATR